MNPTYEGCCSSRHTILIDATRRDSTRFIASLIAFKLKRERWRRIRVSIFLCAAAHCHARMTTESTLHRMKYCQDYSNGLTIFSLPTGREPIDACILHVARASTYRHSAHTHTRTSYALRVVCLANEMHWNWYEWKRWLNPLKMQSGECTHTHKDDVFGCTFDRSFIEFIPTAPTLSRIAYIPHTVPTSNVNEWRFSSCLLHSFVFPFSVHRAQQRREKILHQLPMT